MRWASPGGPAQQHLRENLHVCCFYADAAAITLTLKISLSLTHVCNTSSHIHLNRGNYTGGWRVWQAMLNNSSPAVSTYEEFETGPTPKQVWGGIPDLWFTAELINLFRDLVVLESETAAGHLTQQTSGKWSLSLLHGIPQAWRADPAGIVIRRTPTKLGCSVSVSVVPGEPMRLDLQCSSSKAGVTAAAPPSTVHIHTGRQTPCSLAHPARNHGVYLSERGAAASGGDGACAVLSTACHPQTGLVVTVAKARESCEWTPLEITHL